MERCNFWKNKSISAGFAVSTCPPGQVLAGPDMSKSRLLIQFNMFRVQNKVSDEISKWFCMFFAGEAQKSSYFDQKPKYLIKITPKIPKNR